MKFKVKRIPISNEEKEDRVKFFMEVTGQKVSKEAFMKKEIFDEFVNFICLNCQNEEELEADIVFELFDEEIEDYQVLTCHFCGQETFVPKDIYTKINKKNSK